MQRTHLWIGAAIAGVALAAAAVDSLGGEAANTAPAAPEGPAKDGVAAEPHIKIFCDMEGISGIVFKSFVTNDSDRYAEGQRYLMGDLNACIQGCIEGGAGRITVQDIHSQCNNVIWGDLHERAECILGNPPRFEGIEAYDGLILLGYHAKAGTHAPSWRTPVPTRGRTAGSTARPSAKSRWTAVERASTACRSSWSAETTNSAARRRA